MPGLSLSFASKEDTLSVRSFSIHERLSSLFVVSILAVSELEDLDLDALVGKAAAFHLHSGIAHALTPTRVWAGICSDIEQLQVETTGLSTYRLRIVPTLWRATLRRNHRIFQHLSVPEIAARLLAEWEIEPVLSLTARYPVHEYRVQYGESDFAFLCRILEEAGISFYFSHGEQGGHLGSELTRLVLADAPQSGERRSGPPLPFVDNPNHAAEREFVTRVAVGREVRPGQVTIRDFDFRTRPDTPLFAEARIAAGAAGAAGAGADEARYEQYHYLPGAFSFAVSTRGDTPVADDRGAVRVDPREAQALSQRTLDSARGGRRSIRYETNATDLAPGVVFTMGGHPRKDLAPDAGLLVVASSFHGSEGGEWVVTGEAVIAADPFRPALTTPKPRVVGVQSAIVVGPAGEEIHTDELGRVRVQFPWDREGRFDNLSSCWIRVSQGWAGSAYGMMAIPRVGQEVLVDFFDGDPDRPVIVGRVYNSTTRVPYALPAEKTKSGWKSDSSPGAGGFNELSFEDAKGREIVHVQAQRDYTEVVKRDQSSTVLRNRSASVSGADSVVVGGSRSVSVEESQIHIVGGDELASVTKSRTAIVGMHDAIEAGESFSVTVGEGVAITVHKDRRVVVTNGAASIALGPGGISVDTTGNLEIRADGVLTLSGKEVRIDGAPNVLLNTAGALPAAVPKAGMAALPMEPGKPGGGGAGSQPAVKLQARDTQVVTPGGIEEVEVEEGAEARAGGQPASGTAAKDEAPGLDEVAAAPPASPGAAPRAIRIGSTAAAAMREVQEAGALAAMVRDEATRALSIYRLAAGESLASLPSAMEVIGPVLGKTIPAYGLAARDVEMLVNAGSAAGIFHLGRAGGAAAPLLALRTAAAPRAVSGAAVEAEVASLSAAGAPPEEVLARALSAQGVAVYRGDPEGGFTMVEAAGSREPSAILRDGHRA